MTTNSLDLIAEATFRVLQETYCDRKCVPASAILLKVLHRHNYLAAYPLSVRAEILNAAMHQHIQKHGRYTDRTVPDDALGSIIGNPPGSAWSGHMGIVVPKQRGDQHAFIDLTIGQGNAPASGIVLSPQRLYVGDDFVRGRRPFYIAVNGCHLTYTAFPNDHNYDSGTNWMAMPGLDQAVQMVVDRLYS